MFFRSKHSAKAFKYGHFLWERKHTMTNTIRLKITCFLLLFTVLLIKGILDLAWHLATRMKFGTCEQNWDLYGTISGLSPKFGTSFKALFLLFGFFIFRDQIFRNRDRDFFPRPNFPKPRLVFRDQISKPKCQSLIPWQ